MLKRVSSFAIALGALLLAAVPAHAGSSPLEPMYANDTVVFMQAPPAVAGNVQTSQDFYIVQYPTDTSLGPVAVSANGYHSLCDPCLFPGPPVPPYRDTVLNGSPGFGTNGTAGSFNPNWHVFIVVPSPAWLADPSFTPVRSVAELDAGEAAGHFLPINQGGDNPFELDTGITFLCVLVSSNS
jgi:hypothetical protein